MNEPNDYVRWSQVRALTVVILATLCIVGLIFNVAYLVYDQGYTDGQHDDYKQHMDTQFSVTPPQSRYDSMTFPISMQFYNCSEGNRTGDYSECPTTVASTTVCTPTGKILGNEAQCVQVYPKN